MVKRRHLLCLAVVTLHLASISFAAAETYSWTGNSLMSNAWSDPGNWAGANTPLSAATTDITITSPGFNSASAPNSLQDINGAGFQLRSMTFSMPGVGDNFTLSGGRLSFVGLKTIIQSSPSFVTISNPIAADGQLSGPSADLTITGDG
jgi:hypothetical protein